MINSFMQSVHQKVSSDFLKSFEFFGFFLQMFLFGSACDEENSHVSFYCLIDVDLEFSPARIME